MSQALGILLEDNHLLVLNKPAPLATMGAAAGEPSLLEQAKDYIRRKYNKPGNVYLGVVSRLDSFVTGTVIFARTSKAASRISEQFRNGSIRKTYLAIVPHQSRFPEHGTLRHMIYKNDSRKRMFAVAEGNVPAQFAEQAKRAELNYRTIKKSGDSRLIEIDLVTGRKHQIRAQLAAEGCPVTGDRKYASDESFKSGIALHCRSLQFLHPTLKTEVVAGCEPPNWWNLPRFEIS
ncbi:MAG: RNA pseudouridine synthase [Planctomycetota bacterium]